MKNVLPATAQLAEMAGRSAEDIIAESKSAVVDDIISGFLQYELIVYSSQDDQDVLKFLIYAVILV